MENKLPADPLSLILGIIALVIGIGGCCCYGIFAIIPLALGIIGLVAANRSIKLYEQNSQDYLPSSRNNVGTARIINIIAIIFNGIVVLIFVAFLVLFGTAASTGIWEEIQKNSTYSGDWEESTWENDTLDTDTLYDYGDDFNQEELDSLSTDSIFLEEVFPENDSL